jgi:hypothetical protein
MGCQVCSAIYHVSNFIVFISDMFKTIFSLSNFIVFHSRISISGGHSGSPKLHSGLLTKL